MTGFLGCQKMVNLARKWVTDELLVNIINESMNITGGGDINTNDLNRAVTNYYRAKTDILLCHVANTYGVYKTTNEIRIDGKRKRSTRYYFTTIKNELPQMPNGNTVIYGTKASVEQPNVVTRQSFKTTQKITDQIDLTISESRTHKRLRKSISSVKLEDEETGNNEKRNKKAEAIQAQTFWDSPEARVWFGKRTFKNWIYTRSSHIEKNLQIFILLQKN